MKNINSKFSRRSIGLKRLYKNSPGYLHNTTRGVLLCSRIMGLLPLNGLTSETSKRLRFNLRSPYTIYYVFSFLGQVLMFLFNLNHLGQQGISLDNINNMIFYTLSFATFMILAKTGWYWPLLMMDVEKMERKLPAFRKNYNTIVTLTLTLTMLSGAVEAILYIANMYTIIHSCSPNYVPENYFKVNSPWVFNYTPVNIWSGIICEIFHIQSTFLWSYSDWLMMIISLYLTEYFIIHKERLKKAVTKVKFSCCKFRIEYLRIIHLMKLIKVRVEIFIVASVGTNLYWITIQLYYALNDEQTPPNHAVVCKIRDSVDTKYLFFVVQNTYNVFSFSYVVLRSLLLLQFAARIQSNAYQPVHILYDLPNSKFSAEAQRYISQVKDFKIALSGMDFFYVSRKMILSFLGTVVTYELVLYQFNNS